jgi:TRAP-type C4-dicarboxylate transport system substrate-binding protein
MKRIFLVVLVVVVLGGLIFGGCAKPAPPPDQPVTLKMVSFESATHPMLAGQMEIFNEELEKASNGLLTIDWVGGPEVISFHEQPGAASSGAIDIYFGPGTLYDEEVPETLIHPFTYVTYEEEVARGFDEYMDEIHREKMNVVWIGRMSFEWPFYMAANAIIETPADLKGLIVAVSPTTEASVEAVGMVPFDTEEASRRL